MAKAEGLGLFKAKSFKGKYKAGIFLVLLLGGGVQIKKSSVREIWILSEQHNENIINNNNTRRLYKNSNLRYLRFKTSNLVLKNKQRKYWFHLHSK